MAIFNLPPQFGFSVRMFLEHNSSTSVNDVDFVISKTDEPTMEFSFAGSLLTENQKDYARSFFLSQNGNQDVFLFEDPMDFFATHTEFDTGFEIKTRGVVLEDNGIFFLAKAYSLFVNPINYVVYRPITRPKNPVTVYDNLGNVVSVTIDYDTGEITSGGVANLYWEGTFYTPVRFQSDKLPITIKSYPDPDDNLDYHRFSIPDLRFVEIKESPYRIPFSLNSSYSSHYYQLPFEIDSSIDTLSKTDIYKSEADREIRESFNSYRYSINQSNQLLIGKDTTSYKKKEYLIGLYRLCLGSLLPFRVNNTSIGFDELFRFDSEISFEMTAYDKFEDLPYNVLYSVSNLNLKQYNGSTFFYCDCWKFTRSDNTVIAITNHNRPIIIDGLRYLPNSAIASVSSTNTGELNIDATEAKGAFEDTGIKYSDLESGKFDNADIEAFSANWNNETKIKVFFEGVVGGYTIGYLGSNGKTFSIECLSFTEKFNRNIPRLTSSTCPHRFTEQGYGKCNITISTSFQETALVTDSNLDVITLDQSTTGYEGGELEFTSGELSNTKIAIVDVSGNSVTLLYTPPIAPNIGDSVKITRRCGKTAGDCNAYGNIANFGGQPLYPTSDQKIAGADAE